MQKKYKILKYKIFKNGNRVYAVSTYEGKNVRACASCDPEDEYNEEIGIKLAEKRCELKIAKKRAKYANEAMSKAVDELARAQAKVEKMNKFLTDANFDQDRIETELKELLEKI